MASGVQRNDRSRSRASDGASAGDGATAGVSASAGASAGTDASARTGAGAERDAPIPVRRIQRASDQVAAQLRELIMTGVLEPGARLPTEQALASNFGVSRATIREALTSIAAAGLTRTRKGVNGGTFVTTPSAAHVGDALHSGVALLSRSNEITLPDLLEVRDLLEVPVARMAAQRRTEADLERLRSTVPAVPLAMPVSEQFIHNRGFHESLVDSCHNTLLMISARPIYVLQSRIGRSKLGPEFHETINEHHRGILEAVEGRDPEQAARLMQEHLTWLRPQHERVWGG